VPLSAMAEDTYPAIFKKHSPSPSFQTLKPSTDGPSTAPSRPMLIAFKTKTFESRSPTRPRKITRRISRAWTVRSITRSRVGCERSNQKLHPAEASGWPRFWSTPQLGMTSAPTWPLDLEYNKVAHDHDLHANTQPDHPRPGRRCAADSRCDRIDHRAAAHCGCSDARGVHCRPEGAGRTQLRCFP